MSDEIKELVKRLHGGKCPQCYGFGEVSYGGELVRCSCLGKYEAPISMEHRKAAADALEVMAGEVERLKVAIEYNGRQCIDTMNKMHKQHAAERDRLKAALDQAGDAICDVFEQMAKGRWQDDMGHLVMNNTAMLQLKDVLAVFVARKALGGDA